MRTKIKLEKTVVEFRDIGRGKRTWTAELAWDPDVIERHVKASVALRSSAVWVEIVGGCGTVHAGAYTVGKFTNTQFQQALTA